MSIAAVKLIERGMDGTPALLDEFRIDPSSGAVVRTSGARGSHGALLAGGEPLRLSAPAQEEMLRIAQRSGIVIDTSKRTYSIMDGQAFLAALAAQYGRGSRLEVEMETG